jgi:hypothetical protein
MVQAGEPFPHERTNMQNVIVSIKGDLMILTIDLSKRQGKSASGKTTIIATTSGNVAVPNDKHSGVVFGLNVYTKE